MKGCDEMARNRLLFNTNDDYLEIFSAEDSYSFEEEEITKSPEQRRREIYMIMRRARIFLTPLEAKCMELKYDKNMRTGEIAKALGKNPSDVSKALTRARITMKKIMWVAGVRNYS